MSKKNRESVTETETVFLPGYPVDTDVVPQPSANGTAPAESAYAKYRRLRVKRTAKIEQYTRLLVNLGNRRSYPWTDEDKEATLNFMARMDELVRSSMNDTKSSAKTLGI
jgi:hypothetical protein